MISLEKNAMRTSKPIMNVYNLNDQNSSFLWLILTKSNDIKM